VASRIEIDEDLRFQRRDWFFQRIGWCALAIVLLAGLAGLLGPGPLSQRTRSDGRGLEIRYERFIRNSAQTDLFFRIAPEAHASDQARLLIQRDHLAAYRLQRIDPEPAGVRSLGEYVEYSFDAAAGNPLAIRFTMEPDELGRHAVSIRLDDGPAVDLVQFTYP
jgi:hypothetical protein